MYKKKNKPKETLQYLLDLPPKDTKQTMGHVKSHLSALQNLKNPLYGAVKEEDRCWLEKRHALDGVKQSKQLNKHTPNKHNVPW